jgi:hypothetical protein
VEDVLLDEVSTHLFTTAHVAAELLGAAGVTRAIPTLRESLASEDYMTRARAMVALAQLGDAESIPAIEQALEHSPNPRVTIYAVKALEILKSRSSLPLIFRRIERRAETFVRDELILSSASLLGIFDWFYPLYLEFLDDRDEAIRTLRDLAAASGEAVSMAITALRDDPRHFRRTAIAHFESDRMDFDDSDLSGFIIDALRDRNVGQLERFRFLVAALMVRRTTTAPR